MDPHQNGQKNYAKLTAAGRTAKGASLAEAAASAATVAIALTITVIIAWRKWKQEMKIKHNLETL